MRTVAVRPDSDRSVTVYLSAHSGQRYLSATPQRSSQLVFIYVSTTVHHMRIAVHALRLCVPSEVRPSRKRPLRTVYSPACGSLSLTRFTTVFPTEYRAACSVLNYTDVRQAQGESSYRNTFITRANRMPYSSKRDKMRKIKGGYRVPYSIFYCSMFFLLGAESAIRSYV